MREKTLTDVISEIRSIILKRRNEEGFWIGKLSSSAVSTAIAAVALYLHDPSGNIERVKMAENWLLKTQNSDGGWGDTDRSLSNYPATVVVVSFLTKLKSKDSSEACLKGMEYVKNAGGFSNIGRYYGDDLTFSVPIRMVCAIAELIEWKDIPHLPYEAVLMPRRMLRLFRIPVVSYAIPALCAVGLLIQNKNPTGGFIGLVRRKANSKAMRLLAELQPESGGYLEATPLTGFVLIALTELGLEKCEPAKKSAEFLKNTQRVDGSWPIDENLSVWVTALALTALNSSGMDLRSIDFQKTKQWLLSQQGKGHIFTDSPPGGFPWTHLKGGVPDADDTGTVLALLPFFGIGKGSREVAMAIEWCRKTQNPDGGWPTFCKGWGKLPFDRSSVDVTAHVLLGLHAVGVPDDSRIIRRGLKYLLRQQLPNGSFKALWFGNELEKEKNNYTYATSQALRTLIIYRKYPEVEHACSKCARWLIENQNEDGGWGGAMGIHSTPEETSFGILGLCSYPDAHCDEKLVHSIEHGVEWLLRNKKVNEGWKASPIGLYFAQLWYYEEAYSYLFPLWALAEAKRVIVRSRRRNEE